MALPRREEGVSGPYRADPGDIDAVNTVFADSFTDRYRRDGLVGVRVPRLNPAIWDYAMQDAGEGAMVWRDGSGSIVAFNIAHLSGAEGWMGPLAVRPARQGSGIGTTIVRAATDWLREHDAITIGLETMPRTVDNIGFYSQLGFVPQYLTITMVGEVRPYEVGDVTFLSDLAVSDRDAVLEAMRDRLQESAPGCDYTREFQLTLEMGVGDGAVVESNGVRGFALWHTAGLVEARPAEELRVLKLFADSRETFEKLVVALEAVAADAGLGRVAVRCQTACTVAYGALVRLGYRVRWTDLRMTLDGYPEARLGEREVLLTNWEI
jgi:GNAT superfamily N-acetyltransferase